MVSAIFFPYRRKDMFGNSPASDYRVFGIPAMTISGILGAIYFGWISWIVWWDNLAAGHSLGSLLVIFGAIIAGAIIYLIVRSYRRAQSIRIERLFEETPIE
jgi:hypothetical protein